MATEFYNRNWRMPKSSNSSKVSNYSMSFDGSSEFIDIGTGTSLPTGADAYTISLWVNTNSQTKIPMFFRGELGANKMVLLAYKPNNIVVAHYGNDNNFPFTLTNGVWFNIVLVHSATATELYVNSVSQGSFTTGSLSLTDASTFIGKYGFSGYDFWDGKLDHVAIFDYALSSSQITELYGNSTDGVGNPMALNPKPVAYYPIGDKAAFNGSEYLVTNAASEVYSPYALNFDAASSDYIDLGGDSSLFPTSQLTASIWVKASTQPNFRYVMAAPNNTSYVAYGFQTKTSGGVQGLRFILNTGTAIISPLANVLDNNWHHIASTYDGSSLKMFVDGSEVGTGTSTSGSIIYGTGAGTGAGKLLLGDFGLFSLFFSGSLSNCSIWNAALTSTQVTELYNSGKPSNLNNHSAYSNLVSWWQLGENSSFDGANWTVLNEISTGPNGTSANMGEDAIVNGVGTTGNGITNGMGGADNIVGDAPQNSTGNAVSYGMGVDAKSTSVPS